MKQIFTLAAAAMVAMSANAAEHTFVQNQVKAPVDISKGIHVKAAPKLQKIQKHSKAEDTSFNSFLGDFVHSQWCLDPDSYDDWIGSVTGVQINDNGDGTVTIQNILGYGDIQATYDADEEALVAASGQFLFESVYGNVCLSSFTIGADDEVEFTGEDLLFYLDDENRFEILNDGIAMVLSDGAYAGYMLNALYMFNQFDRVNATMTYQDFDKEDITIGVAIDGMPEDGYINVYGFGDVSCVALAIDGDYVTIPEGQSVFFHSSYGMFYVYPILEQGGDFAGIAEGEVSGTYDAEAQTISLGSLCAYEENTKAVYDVYYAPVISWMQQEDPVGIEQINAIRSTQIYDLQGRLINKLSQGQTYIKDGVKMIKK